MPRLIPRARKWKPDELVRVLRPTAIGSVVLNPRDHLRADDPLVKKHPQLFVRAESSLEELREAQAEEHARRPYVAPDRDSGIRVLDPIPVGEAVVAVDSFHAGGVFAYRYVGKGERVRRDDPIVQANPTLFVNEQTPLEREAG